MNLRDEILKDHSKRQVLKIAVWIGNDEDRFRQFLQIFLNDDYIVVQRIAWVLSTLAEEQPEMVDKHIGKIIGRLDDENIHAAVKRNIIRVLQFLKFPVKYYAKVFNCCIKYISNPFETVSVKCFSMTVAANIAEKFPDLKHELAETINLSLKNTTPGLRARSRVILKKLNSL